MYWRIMIHFQLSEHFDTRLERIAIHAIMDLIVVANAFPKKTLIYRITIPPMFGEELNCSRSNASS